MKGPEPTLTILMADDDADDRLLAGEALAKSRPGDELRFVEDGEELMEYLRGEGRYAEPGSAPAPRLILLDLNMPRKDGREALAEIKVDPRLRHIPVVVLTTSKEEADVFRSYDLGANAYVTKPASFGGLVDCMNSLGEFWLEIVKLPPDVVAAAGEPQP